MPQVESFYCKICKREVPAAQVDSVRLVHKVDPTCKTCSIKVTAHKVVRQLLTVKN